METCSRDRNGDIRVMGKAWRHAEDIGMETFMSEGPHGDMGIAVHGDMYGKNRDVHIACHMGRHMYICARAGERVIVPLVV